MVKEFELTYTVSQHKKNVHHEQTPGVQKAFEKDVRNLIKEIDSMGNAFTEDSNELIVLDTKDIMPDCVVESVKTSKLKGARISVYSIC